VRITKFLPLVLFGALMLSACFSESGLRDEFRQATRALDDLVEAIENEGPLRRAAERARDTVDEAQAALEDFRQNPTAETRQALEDAERRMNDARDALSKLLEQAPERIRQTLGDVVDALEQVRREIRQDLED
jgi:biopolymer transport protein ExbB/TolQ